MAQARQKTPASSEVIMTELVLPSHTNTLGSVFGGTIMSWIDIAAAIAAQRHSRKVVVTASIDALHFMTPIKLGFIVKIHARVNYVGKTSMEVGVRVDAENPITGESRHAVTAYTTFVALDEHGKPTPAPALVIQSTEDKRRNSAAKKRRNSRVLLAQELKKSEQ